MRRILYLFACALAIQLAGCASVPLAPADLDTKAKAFVPEPKQASLYIYRNETFGAAVPMTVTVNGRALGQSTYQTYFYLNLVPGAYKIESHAENVSTLSINADAGKNYFVWQEVKMGLMMARSLLQQVDEKVGRAGVMESKLIASAMPGSEIPPLDAKGGVAPASDSVAQKLRELEGLRKDGLISEAEYESKRRELLQKL